MALTSEAILGADDLPRRKVSIPEWKGDVWVRTMTGAQRDELELRAMGGPNAAQNLKNIRAWMAAQTICDASGRLLFAANDIDALGKKSGAALDRVFEEAQKLNNLGKDDLEEIAKNSVAAPSGDSG